MKNEYKNGSLPFNPSDLMVLWQSSGPEFALMVQEMLPKAKNAYVDSHHTRKITQMHSANKYRDGKWSTYVYIDGKRSFLYSINRGGR